MKKIFVFISEKPQLAFLLTGVLLFVVYLINLGLLPLFADEATRSTVALEMLLSDNYLVPTINGDYYYRKPPFYNWILVGLFHTTGSMSEFIIRLPSVVPLFLFGLTIYWWAKKFIGKNMAFLAAGMFVTCGRMLVYASFIGHIDIFYSWITFLTFICFIEYGSKEKWWQFFVFTYLLSAMAFLSKGLSTVPFQGITLITVLIVLKKFKKFFSIQHLVGILVFLIPVAGYFLNYSEYNDLMGWVEELWDQSAQRTPQDKPWHETVLHIFKFPLEHIYHLAPWSLFAAFLFRKDLKSVLFKVPHLKLITLIFLANLPVYWLSPGYYPRYLFPLYPLLFIVLAFGYDKSNYPKLKSIIFKIFIGFGVVLLIGALVVYFLPSVGVAFSALQCIIILLLTVFSILLLRGKPTPQIIGTLVLLAAFRLLFNWVVMPDRLASGNTAAYREDAIRIAKHTKQTPVKVTKNPTEGGINHDSTFYIEREKMQFLRQVSDYEHGNYSLISKRHLKEVDRHQIVDSMLIRHNSQYFYLVNVPE